MKRVTRACGLIINWGCAFDRESLKWEDVHQRHTSMSFADTGEELDKDRAATKDGGDEGDGECRRHWSKLRTRLQRPQTA